MKKFENYKISKYTKSAEEDNHISMDKQFCGDTAMSIQEICQVLDDEEKRLLALDEKRIQLGEDMKNLLDEIAKEKQMFRQSVDTEIKTSYEIIKNSKSRTVENLKLPWKEKIDPLTVKKEQVREYIKSVQKDFEKLNPKNDSDIHRLKSNLAIYERSLLSPRTRIEIEEESRRDRANLVKMHLDQVEGEFMKDSEEELELSPYKGEDHIRN